MCAWLLASLTEEDFKKLDIIKQAVLMSENREKRKERVKKYLKWVRKYFSYSIICNIFGSSWEFFGNILESFECSPLHAIFFRLPPPLQPYFFGMPPPKSYQPLSTRLSHKKMNGP